MELYFLRHAIAAEPGTIAVSHDSERPLTSEGIEKMEKAVEGMRRADFSFDHIVSSPYLRASETAKIVAEGLGFKGKIRFSDALTPGAELKDLLKLLRDFKSGNKVLLVGHLPSIGEFVSNLISGKSTVAMDYKKGGLCRVDMLETIVPGVVGELKWFLTPKQLRSLSSR